MFEQTAAINQVVAIFIAPQKGEPMQTLEKVQAVAGLGLEGDRYASRAGAYSHTRRLTDFDRQATLISQRAVAQTAFSLAETRRNLALNSDPELLNGLAGKPFYIGDVEMKGVELCDPCNRPSVLSNKTGFLSAFDKCGGLRARILTDGVISCGDQLVIPERPRPDIFERIRRLNLPMGEYAVFGSALLDAWELRRAADLDIIVTPELFKLLEENGWEQKQAHGFSLLRRGEADVTTVQDKPTDGNYFPDRLRLIKEATVIYGIPFVSVREVMACKKAYNRPKDRRDILLLEEYLWSHWLFPK